MEKRGILTLEDLVHFVIYRELDKMHVPNPYKEAARICTELRKAVEYRSSSVAEGKDTIDEFSKFYIQPCLYKNIKPEK